MDKSDRKIRLAKIITFLLCIVVFGIVFKYTFDYLDIKDVKIEESIKATDLKSKSFTCSILQIDYDKEIVKLYDFNKKLAYEETYYISNATKYLDKDAHLLAKGSFKAGLIVDVTVTETTGMISKMQLSPKSWETTGVTNYKFDYENKVMEINGVKYILDNDVVLIHDGTKLNYQDLIDANVILSIRGYDDIVLGIEVTEFLGKIKLKYNDNLKGSTVQIGNDKICDIEEVEDLYIKPGEYKIVITKKGIEDIVTKTVVEENTTTEVDVTSVIVKECLLKIKCNEDSYLVTIKSSDGYINRSYTNDPLTYTSTDTFSTGEIPLPYGIYVLTFSKNGHKSVTKKIELQSESKTINLSFSKESDTEEDSEATVEKIKLVIEASPSDASIYVNGDLKGTGKVTVRVPKGEVNIKVTKAGYTDMERTYTLDGDKEYMFELTNDDMYKSPTGEIVENDGGI